MLLLFSSRCDGVAEATDIVLMLEEKENGRENLAGCQVSGRRDALN